MKQDLTFTEAAFVNCFYECRINSEEFLCQSLILDL